MFKLLFVQLCLATVALSAPSKGVKRDISSPGSIANLFARDDDFYYGQYPSYAGGYAGGYGYYPRADVISPLSYYNDGYGYGSNYGLGYGSGYGFGGVYPTYYAAGGLPYGGYAGYNRYRYGYGGLGGLYY